MGKLQFSTDCFLSYQVISRLNPCRPYFQTIYMDSKDKPLITEDGQRLTIENGQITGTQDPGPGLAFETGNVQDESSQGGSSCPQRENATSEQEHSSAEERGQTAAG